MDRIERIENAIVMDSEDVFDVAEVRTDLNVTIRIAKTFYDFLTEHGESPNAEQIDYVADTIRSGIDEFYLLASSCRRLIRRGEIRSFNLHEHLTFLALRERFMRGFERLEASEVSAVSKLDILFELTHLELIFMAQNFPSAIFADRPGDSMTAAELRQDIKRMIGSKLSWTRDAD